VRQHYFDSPCDFAQSAMSAGLLEVIGRAHSNIALRRTEVGK